MSDIEEMANALDQGSPCIESWATQSMKLGGAFFKFRVYEETKLNIIPPRSNHEAFAVMSDIANPLQTAVLDIHEGYQVVITLET
jgi:hypothetical protein